MSRIPSLLAEGRSCDVVLVALSGVGQGAALGIVALATRDLFAAMHGSRDPAFATFALLGVAGCAVVGCQLLSRVRAEILGQSFAKSLRRMLYRHIAGMNESQLSQKRVGGLSLRFVGDLSAARNWAGLGLARVAAASVVIPSAVLALYLVNPTLALAASLPIALSLAMMFALAVRHQDRHRGLRAKRASLAVFAMERISSAPLLDLAGRTGKEAAALDAASVQLMQRAADRIRRLALLRAIPQIGAAIATIAILAVALQHDVSAANAAGALAVIGILAIPLSQLADVWDRYCAWRVAKAKCEALLANDSARRRPVRRGSPVAIDMRDLRFRGLHMDLSIPAGALVRVEGGYGTGKSSLLSLIAAQNRPDHGKVAYGKHERLPRICYVTDTPLILQGSLRRNLTTGLRPRPRDAEIHDAAHSFGLSDLIARLGGLDGRLQERGGSISSGEALRIGLVHAILTKPDLIVLDSAQLAADPDFHALIGLVRSNSAATVMVTYHSNIDNEEVLVLRVGNGTAKLGRQMSHAAKPALAS